MLGKARKGAWLVACAAGLELGTGVSSAQAPINVSAQPLAAALVSFSRQSGVELFVDSSLTAGKRSQGAAGASSPEAALRQILSGTGLRYQFSSNNTVTLVSTSGTSGGFGSDAVVVEQIEVQGESANGPVRGYVASRDATATKTDTPIIEVPQAVNIVTRDQIEAQGAQSITAAARYTPGVVAGFGDSNKINDVLQSRGFFARYNLNGSRLPYGQYSFGMMQIEPYGLERFDILKGPSSVLYGQNTPGGLVNMVSKRPTRDPIREVVLSGGTHDRIQGAFDIAGAANEDGTIQYRLTALARDSDGQVDFGKDERVFIAPALTWQPTDATSLTFLSHYQKEDVVSDYQPLPYVGTVVPNANGQRIPRSRFTGEPGWDGFQREQFSLGYDFRHDFNETWTIRQIAQFNSVDATAQASPGLSVNADSTELTRLRSRGTGGADTFTIDTNAEARFDVGATSHVAILGVDYLHLEDDYAFASLFPAYATPLDLYNPVYGQPALGDVIPRFSYDQTRDQIGIYLQDQIKLDRWVLTLGGRHDWSYADTSTLWAYAPGAPVNIEHDASAFTGRAGLTYLFDNGVAPYAAYSTSFEPINGTDFFVNPFKPMEGEQYEIGVKYQPVGTNALITLSAYDLTQTNVLTPDETPGHAGFQIQLGEARVRGIELEAKASLSEGWDLIGGYAYTDSEVTEASASGGLLGNELPMVPNHQASAWVHYKFQPGTRLHGLGLGGGVRYLGEAFGDAANTIELPGTTLVDAALSFDFGALSPSYEGLTLRINAANLLDETYVSYCQGALQCYYGQGRTVLGSLTYRW